MLKPYTIIFLLVQRIPSAGSLMDRRMRSFLAREVASRLINSLVRHLGIDKDGQVARKPTVRSLWHEESKCRCTLIFS